MRIEIIPTKITVTRNRSTMQGQFQKEVKCILIFSILTHFKLVWIESRSVKALFNERESGLGFFDVG